MTVPERQLKFAGTAYDGGIPSTQAPSLTKASNVLMIAYYILLMFQ